MMDFPNVAVAVYEEMLKRPTELDVYCQTEQSPNPDSRVMLGADCDRFGVRRVKLDWQLSPLDRRSIRTCLSIVGEQLANSGLGSLRPEPWVMADEEQWSPSLTGGHHHLGTARMSDDPKHGVVDANCRVHGISNLYISDGSVFPTGGYANPLLTIVALSLRTADHIKTLL